MDYRNHDQKYDMAKLDRRRILRQLVIDICFNVFVFVGVIVGAVLACKAVQVAPYIFTK